MKSLILAAIAATVLASAASVRAAETFNGAKFFEEVTTLNGQ